MPYSSIAAAKQRGFNTTLNGAPLTLAQINYIARMYDSIKARGGAEAPMAVAIATFKKKYTKSGGRWVKRETKQEDQSAEVKFTAVDSIAELPGPAQAVWNDVYQIVVKKLKNEGVGTVVAKSRARRAAVTHINRYYDHNPETGKWTKKPKEPDNK